MRPAYPRSHLSDVAELEGIVVIGDYFIWSLVYGRWNRLPARNLNLPRPRRSRCAPNVKDPSGRPLTSSIRSGGRGETPSVKEPADR